MEIKCPNCGTVADLNWRQTPDPSPAQPPALVEIFTTFGVGNAFNLNGGMAVADFGCPAPCSIAQQFTPVTRGIVQFVELAIYRSPNGAISGAQRSAAIHSDNGGKIGPKLFDLGPAVVPQRRMTAAGMEPVIVKFEAGPTQFLADRQLLGGSKYWLVVSANPTGTTKDIWNLALAGAFRLAYAMDPTRTGTWAYYAPGAQTCAFRVQATV